jgi:hypothetical protein
VKKEYLLIGFIISSIILAIFQGYYLDKGDLDTYLLFVLHAFDMNLFSTDLLTQTINSHPVYIWRVFGFLVHFIPLKILFLFAFLIQTILITLSFIAFYYNFFNKKRVGLILFFIFIIYPISTPGLGRLGLNPYGYFHASSVAMAFALFVMVLLDRKKWIHAGMITGTIFLFHPITAVFVTIVYSFALTTEFFNSKKVKQPLIGFMFLLVFGSPSLSQQVLHIFNNSAEVPMALWRSIVESRMNHGFFASKWPFERFLQVFLYCSIPFLARNKIDLKRLFPFIAAILFTLFTFVIADVFTIKLLIQLQLGRMMLFAWIIGLGSLACVLSQIDYKTAKSKLSLGLWVILGTYSAYGHSINSQTGYVRTIIIASIILTTTLILLKNISPKIKTFLPILLLIPTVYLSVNRSVTFFSTLNSDSDSPRSAWRETMEWCKNNTQIDEIIMVPIYNEGFRYYSQRSIFVSYKDGAPHNFCNETFLQWWHRMQLFGITLPVKGNLFPKLYHENALKVAKNQNIRFVVIEKKFGPFTACKTVFENNEFSIIDMRED